MPPVLDFWFDLSSTYSYLAAMKAEERAARHGVQLNWRVFLLGVIFKAQTGVADSPFNHHPQRGSYMWRDVARIAAREGLPFVKPADFPRNSLAASRAALAAQAQGHAMPEVARAFFAANYAEGRDVADSAVIADVLHDLGIASAPVLKAAQSDTVKAKLRAETEAAQALGIFGAPTFIAADGEMFWGGDRFEDALLWATGKAIRP